MEEKYFIQKTFIIDSELFTHFEETSFYPHRLETFKGPLSWSE